MMRIEASVAGAWTVLNGDLAKADIVQSANAIGTLTLEILPTSSVYKEIACNTIVRVYDEQHDEWVFYGRVIDVTPGMESNGTISKEAVCEDALGFLQDTAVWIDSRKAYFDGSNSSYPVEIDDDDGSRTIASSSLAKLLLSQHNNTVADNGGDSWKKVKVGTVSLSGETTFSAEYEATTYEMLSAVADDASAEFRSRYDGTSTYIDMAPSLGSNAGTFAVGDNVAQTALKTSMADVVTRMYPYGDKYAKLEKIRRKGTKVTGALKGSDWQTSKGTMLRFPCEGALKCVLKVGARNKDYAMVVFASAKLTKSNAEDAVVRKYTTKRTTGANLTRRYPVPEGAKYVYVYGSGSTCTTYGYYRNKAKNAVKKNYRTDLAFWKSKLTDAEVQAIIAAHCPGATIGSVVDGSNDRSYYIAMNEDKYGAIEGTCLKEGQLSTDKITNARKAIYSINDLKGASDAKSKKIRAKNFIKYACQQLKDRCNEAVELTVTGYDLAEAGLDYDALKLYDRWRVTNSLCGIDHLAEVVRIQRDLLQPWNVEVELGSKVERATGAGKGTSASLTAGIKPSAAGDDDDSAEDEYATLAGQYADAAEKAAEEAVEKADELDQLSYLIQVDSLAAGQMASDAYDTVLPITDAMRGLLADAQDQADSLTSVKESQSKTISLANDLARAQASYAYETEKSVVRWKQTYTADLDAWASEDPAVQAEIAAAYKLLYGANGTAEKPEADSAQGHLNAAKAANVEAASTEAEMRVELASANAYKASCSAAADKAAAAAKKAQKAYDALKKKTTAKRKELDAAKAARDAALAKEAAAKEKVDGANVRCAEAEANYTAAKDALADAEAKVATAQVEVDTAMNGIHQKYQTCIEQTAKKVSISATEETVEGKYQAALDVTARAIQSLVSSAGGSSTYTQTDDGFNFTITKSMTAVQDSTARSSASSAATAASNAASAASNAQNTANSAQSDVNAVKAYMSFTNNNGTGTLTLGGSASTISMGGSTATISLCGGVGSIIAYGSIGQLQINVPSSAINAFAISTGSGSLIMGGGALNVHALLNVNGHDIKTSNGGNISSDGYINAVGNVTCAKLITSSAETASGDNAVISKSGYLRRGTGSSRRYKRDIADVEDDTLNPELLYNIPVRQFVYNDGYLVEGDEYEGRTVIGLIAEEVEEHYPVAVYHNGLNQAENWDVRYIVPPMLKLIQDQKKLIDALTARLDALEGK